jgi:hypothetical protein
MISDFELRLESVGRAYSGAADRTGGKTLGDWGLMFLGGWGIV